MGQPLTLSKNPKMWIYLRQDEIKLLNQIVNALYELRKREMICQYKLAERIGRNNSVIVPSLWKLYGFGRVGVKQFGRTRLWWLRESSRRRLDEKKNQG